MEGHNVVYKVHRPSISDSSGSLPGQSHLRDWLVKNDLQQYEDQLIAHGYDILDDMLTLDLDDLLAIGLSEDDSAPLLAAATQYKLDSSTYQNYDVASILSPVKQQSSEDHRSSSQGVYENWVPPKMRPGLTTEQTECEVYQNMYLNKTNEGPSFTVVDKVTKAAIPFPEECALYILVEPAKIEDDEDKAGREKRESVLNTLLADSITTTVLGQLLEFLHKQEDDEVQGLERAYERKLERIQTIIDMKESDEFQLGNAMQIAAYSKYYHGTITREESEARLKFSGGQPGNYLIRKKSENSMYVFSLCCEGGDVKHFLLERAMKTDGRPGRHFILNKFARLQSCHSVFDVLQELLKPMLERLPELRAIPPPFHVGVLKKTSRRDIPTGSFRRK